MRLAKIVLSTAAALAATLPARAEGTKTLRLEMPAGERFGVENLVGTMRIRAGSGSSVSVVATVHADSQALADTMRLEQVVSREGRKTLRMRYPLDQHRDYLMPRSREHGASQFEYDGRRVSVGKRGVLLYADLEVEVPAQDVDGLFRNLAGVIHADGLQGHVVLDTANGNIFGQRLKGEVVADTGSGDVALEATGDRLERVKADSGSGTVTLRLGPDASFEARADTGSGEVVSRYADAEPILRDHEVVGYRRGARKTRITVHTGSGDLVLEPGR